jgi:hypothetical protein
MQTGRASVMALPLASVSALVARRSVIGGMSR